MRKTRISLIMVLGFGIVFLAVQGHAQMGPGMMGRGHGGWYCPYCGQDMGPRGGYGMGAGYGMGPGMMHRGWGMGPGMMGPGRGMGPGMMHRGWGMGPQYGPQYQQPSKSLEEKEVKEILENYLKSTRNPNLRLGKVKDAGSSYEVEIVTKDDSLVDKIAVDKTTGWMRSLY